MMRSSSNVSVNPQIKRVVDDLLKAASNFDRYENRSAHRDNLVLPVNLEIRDSDTVLDGFSRNISATGIGLITSTEIDEATTAKLSIFSTHSDQPSTILGQCRWCKKYGERWFLSGWQFINVVRNRG